MNPDGGPEIEWGAALAAGALHRTGFAGYPAPDGFVAFGADAPVFRDHRGGHHGLSRIDRRRRWDGGHPGTYPGATPMGVRSHGHLPGIGPHQGRAEQYGTQFGGGRRGGQPGAQQLRTLQDFDVLSTSAYEGREPRHDNEIAIGPRVADLTGAGIGDTIAVDFQGQSQDFLVVGLLQGSQIGRAHV